MRQRRIRKWSDEQLREAVKNSTNLTDVLRALGLRVAGGNHASIKYWIDEFGLDTSHFNSENQLNGLKIARHKAALSREEVLCENSEASKNTLKKWARKELDYKCVKCYNAGFHNGLPLTLQLDHINGVPNDNRIENLRWLCPNCHTQTETFAGKKGFRNGVLDVRKRCATCPTVLHDKHAVHCRPCEERRRAVNSKK